MPWGIGIMECWNIGFGGRRSVFKCMAELKNINSDHHPLLIPNTRFFSPIRRLCEPKAIIPLYSPE
jgi:hypothetical protein